MTRLPAPDPSRWSESVRKRLGEDRRPVLPDDDPEAAKGAPPNILFTIAEHPALLEPFLGFAAALAMQGTLERRDSELLALRAAWNCRSNFEWGHHVAHALAHGLEPEEIDELARPAGEIRLTGRDLLLVRAADELHAEQTIGDATWKALAREFEPAQLVEIPFVVGNYTMLSMVANATEVPLEPGYPPLPARKGRPLDRSDEPA